MQRQFIIPAAGKAQRFNGIIKELAPLPHNRTPLGNALELALQSHASDITILTSPAKYWLHSEFVGLFVKEHNIARGTMHLLMQRDYTHDLWSGIQQALLFNYGLSSRFGKNTYRSGGLILPDTITDFNPMYAEKEYNGLTLGLFDTTEPYRFSLFENGKIITKPTDKNAGTYKAWGVVLWNSFAAKILAELQTPTTYDQAFQHVIDAMGYDTFPLDYYYDLASIDKYIEYTADVNEVLYGNKRD